MSGSPGAVLFDLDGTLIDTAGDFHACLNRLQTERQQPEIAFASVHRQVSNGARALLKLAQHEHDRDFEANLQRLLELYSLHIADHSQLYEGLDALLQQLESTAIPWGIVTNKPLRFAQPLLSRLNLLQRCSTLICPDHVSQRKPHPEGILLACKETGSRPQQSIYIGDHVRDIEAGRKAGCVTIGCRYGYIDPTSSPENWGADYLAATPAALCHWLQQHLNLSTPKETPHV